jgi:hypothetical protein
MAATHADRVREYTRRKFIEPARQGHQATVKVVVGEIQKAVQLSNRVSLVCQALKSDKFLKENHLLLEKWEGPPSGQSTTVVFTYRLLDSLPHVPAHSQEWPFQGLRGVAKDVFRSLGGGETFLCQERKEFQGPGDGV